MVEDLIKRLRTFGLASIDDRKEAADLIEQQAARLTALESERDALLAAAGKEAGAVASDVWEAYLAEQKMVAGMPGLHARPSFIAGFHAAMSAVSTTQATAIYQTRGKLDPDSEWTDHRKKDFDILRDDLFDKRIVYTAPTAALEHGGGRDAEPVAWFHNTARKGDKPVYEQVAEEFSYYPAIPLYSGPVEPIYCQACGDGITAHDPGICGNCFAMKHSGSALAMLKRIPTTPEQMIDFIGSHFNSMEAQEWSEFSGDAVAKPAGDLSMVRYSLTVHDLLSAFDWADLSADAIDAALSQKAGEK
jgi:hypothetical protein